MANNKIRLSATFRRLEITHQLNLGGRVNGVLLSRFNASAGVVLPHFTALFENHTGSGPENGIRFQFLQQGPRIRPAVVLRQSAHQIQIAAAGGSGVVEISLYGFHQILGEHFHIEERSHQPLEVGLPLGAMGIHPVLVLGPGYQMGHLMCEGDQECVFVQVVVDGYAVTQLSIRRTVIAILTVARLGDAHGNAMVNNPLHTNLQR